MVKRLFQGQGLLSRFLRACSWVTAEGLMMQVVRTVRLLVLTWLLAPEIFGLMAVVWCLLGLLREFSDTGIRHALIQNPRGLQKEYLHTAWALTLVRNVLLILVLFTVAPYIYLLGGIYQNPELVRLLRWSCLILLFEGLTSISLVVLQKQLVFKPVVLIQIFAQIIGTVAAIILAWRLRNAWALVISEIIAMGLMCVLSYVVHPYRPRIQWHKQACRELIGYGVMIYIVTLVDALCFRVDILLLPLLGSSYYEVGLYSLAMTVIMAACSLFSKLTITVGFPMLSEVQNDMAKVRKLTTEIIKATQMISLPVFVLLGLWAHELVRILPDKYAGIGELLRCLSVFGFFQVLLRQLSPPFCAINQVGWCLARSILQLVITVGLLVPMYRQRGLIGVCWAINIATIVANIFIWGVSLRVFGWSWRGWIRDTSMLWGSLAGGAAAFGVTYACLRFTDLERNYKWVQWTPYLMGLVGYGLLCLRYYHFRFLKFVENRPFLQE